MVNKELLEKNQFNPGIQCGEDYDLWIRILLAGPKTININEPLITLHNIKGKSLNRSRANKFRGRNEIYKAYNSLMTAAERITFQGNTILKLIVPDPRFVVKKIEHKLTR